MSDRYPQFPPGTLSVTEVIKLSGLMPESAFIDPWYMGRGQAVHLATAFYDRGTLDDSTVANEIRGYLNAWVKFRAETGYTPAFIEKPLLHPVYGYCGTLDRDGLDIKSGSPAPWHILQGGGYFELANANNTVHNPLPTMITGWRTVYLQSDGSYKVHPYSTRDLMQAKKDFLTLLAALKIKQNYGGK